MESVRDAPQRFLAHRSVLKTDHAGLYEYTTTHGMLS